MLKIIKKANLGRYVVCTVYGYVYDIRKGKGGMND